MSLSHIPKHHTPPILFPSRISKHSALFWCLPTLPRSVGTSHLPTGTYQETDSQLLCSKYMPLPIVALPVCQGQVTFEPCGIIKRTPNCLSLHLLNLPMDWQLLRHSVWSSIPHQAASGDALRRGANQSSSAITNKPALSSCAIWFFFLVSTSWVFVRPA